MKLFGYFLLIVFCFSFLFAGAQNIAAPSFKGAVKEKRMNTRRIIINNIITKNLSMPLADSTEENWQDAFWALELMQYKTPWINSCVHSAFDAVEKRSVDFQRSLLELCYASYPFEFDSSIRQLMDSAGNEKVVALCAEYLLRSDTSAEMKSNIAQLLEGKAKHYAWNLQTNIITALLSKRLQVQQSMPAEKIVAPFLAKNYLQKNVVVYSIQRHNRDYAGIVIVKDTAGNFVKNNDGNFFNVPQLARSISNLPFYLTNGNTPQGVFRMDGFAVSKADFIGPTENIQMTMPFEKNIRHFLKDSSVRDTAWTINLYKKLLPAALKEYAPLYESYYAGQAGRTEIIAHGTTIDQDYYKNKTYYPQTPTMGCLCTEEVWSSIDGKRVISDQQQLVNAVKKAGGANGYYIVIELNDDQKPVDMAEILRFIK